MSRYKKATAISSNLTFHKLDWLEKLSLIIGLWFWLYPKPYIPLFTILLILPILGLILNSNNRNASLCSLVEIREKRDGEVKYDVADFIVLPAIFILIRVFLDFECESFYSLLIPLSISFILMLLILFITHKAIIKSKKNKLWVYSALISNLFLYSSAATYGMNCIYDTSKPKVYQAEVIDKSISTRSKGGRTYYIRVTPWGHHYDTERISVSRNQYDKLKPGMKVNIDLKKGLFNIPWYYVE